MADVVAHSIDRGAVGFSTNRYPPHKLPDGRSIPGTFAEVGELVEIAKAIGPRNALMQAVGANFEVLKAMAETTKGRILFSYGTGPQEGMGARAPRALEQLSKFGDLTAITQVRGSGFMFGLQSNLPVQGETWGKLRRPEPGATPCRNPGSRDSRKARRRRARHEAPLPDDQRLLPGRRRIPGLHHPAGSEPRGRGQSQQRALGGDPSCACRTRPTAGRSSTCACSTRALKELGDLFKSEHIFRAWAMRARMSRRSWMPAGRPSYSPTGSAKPGSTTWARASVA